MIDWKKNSKKIIIAIILIIVIAIIYYALYYWKDKSTFSDTNIALIDLEKAISQSPDWNRYLQLDEELKQLGSKWIKNYNGSNRNSLFLTNKGNIEELIGEQIEILKNNFQFEIDLKLSNLNNNLSEYSKNREEFYNLKMSENINTINSTLKRDLDDKKNEVTEQFKEFQAKIHSKYQLDLTNMQFKLSMLDLVPDNENLIIERQGIQLAINRIKLEIEQQTEVEYQRLQEEMLFYSEKRQKTALEEIEEIKTSFVDQFKKDVSAYRQRLEQDFELWRKKREEEIKAAIELRKKQFSASYQEYESNRTIIESQQRQLKDQIIWELKKRAKKIAINKKIDLILIGNININLMDLTSDLIIYN